MMKVWWRSFFWILVFNVVIIMVAWHLNDRAGLVWGFLVALSINYYLVLFNPIQRLARGGRVEVVGNDPWGLNQKAQSLSRRLKTPAPKIITWDSDLAQVFVLSKWPSKAYVGFSSRALKDFNSEELEMLVAWSMISLKSGRVINWTYLGLFLNLILIVLSSIDRILGWMISRRLNQPHGFTLWITAPLIAIFQRGFSSRSDFEKVDKELAKQFPKHLSLAEVFKKMHFQNQTRSSDQNLAFSHLFYSPLIPRQGILPLLRLQPNYRKRIKNLSGHYPV